MIIFNDYFFTVSGFPFWRNAHLLVVQCLVNYVACRGSVYRALGLMVAASPCALAVAPLAYATAISSCARKVSVN